MGVLAEIEVDLHVVQRRVEVVDGARPSTRERTVEC
jgi:hypothetical protein